MLSKEDHWSSLQVRYLLSFLGVKDPAYFMGTNKNKAKQKLPDWQQFSLEQHDKFKVLF